VTTPRSVLLNLEDVCQRLTGRLADATAQLVIAESTRDAALKENDELKETVAKLSTMVEQQQSMIPDDDAPRDTAPVNPPAPDGDAAWRAGPNVD
jgi:hypothetical protein